MNGLFLVFTAVSGSHFFRQKLTSIYAYLELLRFSSLLRRESLLDVFLCCNICSRHEQLVMPSFCLLTSMELILRPYCCLVCLHSNDRNSLIYVYSWVYVIAVSVIVLKRTNTEKDCEWLNLFFIM